ncbi:MAG: hypothetical protein ACPGGK_14110 [Pikeienuella sp.]
MTEPIGAFRLFTSALTTTFTKFPALFLLSAPFIGIGFLINNALYGIEAATMEYELLIEQSRFGAAITSMLISLTSISAAYCFIAAYLLNARNGRPFQIVSCLNILRSRLFRLTISQIVAAIALIASFSTIAGGVWLSGLWAISAVIVIAEPGEGLGFIRSTRLTKNHRWSLGIASTGVMVASMLFSFLMNLGTGAEIFAADQQITSADAFRNILENMASAMFLAPFAVLAYLRILEHNEGTPSEIEEIFR